MSSELRPPFADPAQQAEAARLGLWAFLAGETMMFGSLLLVAAYYRQAHPAAVGEALGHFHYLLAGLNTALLLTGSLCVGLGQHAAGQARRRAPGLWLGLAALLGLAFLALKGVEYRLDYGEGLLPFSAAPSPLRAPAARLFVNLYLLATALHALHLAIGVALVGHLALRHRQAGALRVELTGLYWHLVDFLWLLLYPSLYLLGRPA